MIIIILLYYIAITTGKLYFSIYVCVSSISCRQNTLGNITKLEMDLSADAVDQEIEIIETTKGKPLAIFNGYQFRKYRQNENVTVWVCLKEKKDKCKGRMRTKNIEIIHFSDNSCKPDVATSEVKNNLIMQTKRVREESLYSES